MIFMADMEGSADDRKAGKTSETAPCRASIDPAPLRRARSPGVPAGRRRAEARPAGPGR